MSGVTLWARRGAIESHWRLGDLGTVAGRHAMLLGWEAPDAIDGGIPPLVADTWARALAANARVTFLCSQPIARASADWLASGDDGEDFTKAAPGRSPLGSAVARLRGQPGDVALVCSKRSATIAQAFDDAVFCWWLQSQVLLLSPLEAPPPALAPDTVLALLDEDWATRSTALRSQGVIAVARPAVDGDALGLLAFDAAASERLLAAIAEEARASALGWSVSG